MAKLKVFKGNYDGRSYRLVATTSKAKASKLLGILPKFFKQYVSLVPEHRSEHELAISEPETVFTCPIILVPNKPSEWVKVTQVKN